MDRFKGFVAIGIARNTVYVAFIMMPKQKIKSLSELSGIQTLFPRSIGLFEIELYTRIIHRNGALLDKLTEQVYVSDWQPQLFHEDLASWATWPSLLTLESQS